MSYDEEDAARDQWLDDLYREHKQEILSDLTGERMRSYFLANRHVAQPAFVTLNDALRLRDAGFVSPSFLFAAISIEVAVKAVLLKPIVSGLVHDSATSTLIADLAIGRNGLDQLRDLLFHSLSNIAGIDLKTFRRALGGEGLWTEIRSVQEIRNRVVHRAHIASAADAEAAIAIAQLVLNDVFPTVVRAVRLHVHEQGRVCDDWTCEHEGKLSAELIAKIRSYRSD